MVIIYKLSQLAGKEEKLEKGHNRLRGGITGSRALPMLHSLHSRLCVSAGDVPRSDLSAGDVPRSDLLVTPGDAYHLIVVGL